MANRSLPESIDRALDRLLLPFVIVAGLMLAIISTMVTIDVAVRWIKGRPLVGIFELAETLLVYCTFFALGYVQFRNQQLRVDILSGRATGRLAGALRLLDCLASLIIYGIIAAFSGAELIKAYQGGFLRRGMVEIPTAVLLAPIVIGAALVCIVLIWQLLKAVRQIATGVDDRQSHMVSPHI
jgi:TRAP-type C4-dicarboxylate transport system permease small subunit